MSNRTLVELNHDYCPSEGDLIKWARKMKNYMSSGDPAELPQGITFKHTRHHSEPDPMAETSQREPTPGKGLTPRPVAAVRPKIDGIHQAIQ